MMNTTFPPWDDGDARRQHKQSAIGHYNYNRIR
jgi:hypothetical protein